MLNHSNKLSPLGPALQLGGGSRVISASSFWIRLADVLKALLNCFLAGVDFLVDVFDMDAVDCDDEDDVDADDWAVDDDVDEFDSSWLFAVDADIDCSTDDDIFNTFKNLSFYNLTG